VITFEDGTLEGTAGCGGLFASYDLAGNTLSIKAGSIRMAVCSREDEVEDDEVLAALNGSSQIKSDIGRMLLQDDQGTTRVILTPIKQEHQARP
jgi:heat shock protein HslJ